MELINVAGIALLWPGDTGPYLLPAPADGRDL